MLFLSSSLPFCFLERVFCALFNLSPTKRGSVQNRDDDRNKVLVYIRFACYSLPPANMSTTYSGSIQFTASIYEHSYVHAPLTLTNFDSAGVVSVLPGSWTCYRANQCPNKGNRSCYNYTYGLLVENVPKWLSISGGSFEIGKAGSPSLRAHEVVNAAGKLIEVKGECVLSNDPCYIQLTLDVLPYETFGHGRSSLSSPVLAPSPRPTRINFIGELFFDPRF